VTKARARSVIVGFAKPSPNPANGPRRLGHVAAGEAGGKRQHWDLTVPRRCAQATSLQTTANYRGGEPLYFAGIKLGSR
jgi:hypothetical protein